MKAFNRQIFGAPEIFGRRKRDLFVEIVDHIRQKAMSYSTKNLSNAGKMTMIKSVLSTIPTYYISCFKLFKTYANATDGLDTLLVGCKPGKEENVLDIMGKTNEI